VSIDWNAALYDPIYDMLGVDATVEDGTIRVIDQTAGVEIETSPISLPTIQAAALVRVTELAAKNISETSLLGGTITIGGNDWTVQNIAPKPGPGGKGTGELQLLLINGDA
jgi:hypothetical protein